MRQGQTLAATNPEPKLFFLPYYFQITSIGGYSMAAMPERTYSTQGTATLFPKAL